MKWRCGIAGWTIYYIILPLAMDSIQMSAVKLYRMPRKCGNGAPIVSGIAIVLFIFGIWLNQSLWNYVIFSISALVFLFIFRYFPIFLICLVYLLSSNQNLQNNIRKFLFEQWKIGQFPAAEHSKLMICWLSRLFCVWNYIICWPKMSKIAPWTGWERKSRPIFGAGLDVLN